MDILSRASSFKAIVQWQRRGKKEIHVHNFEDLLLAGKASNIKNNWFNVSREDEIFIQRTEELNPYIYRFEHLLY